MLNLSNRKRMPAGPGWPGPGVVVAVVSLFGVGPGWYFAGWMLLGWLKRRDFL